MLIQVSGVTFLVLIILVGIFFITEDFWNVHFLKKDWYRCVFRSKNNKVRALWLKPDPDDGKGVEIMHYKKGMYQVDGNAVVYSGRWNIPTLYFLESTPEPIMFGDIKTHGISAEKVEAMRKWHVFTDIMNAMDVESLTQTWMLIIMIGAVVLTGAALYYGLNAKIDQAIAPLLVPTVVLGSG